MVFAELMHIEHIWSANASTNTTHPSIEHQKFGTIKLVVPLVGLLAVAWAFYATRKHQFPKESVGYVALCAASFTITSVSMNVLNKVCVTLTNAPSTLTTIQMLFTVVATVAMSSREIMQADRKKAFRWMVVPVMYAGMLNSSLLGYKYLSLCLVTVFRNLAPLLTLMVEGLVMDAEHKPPVTTNIVMSLLMMVVGAFVFSYGQADVTLIGIIVVFFNTILAMGDRLLQRRLLVSECKDLPLSACMTINNSLGIIPTFGMALAMHEVQGYAANYSAWTDPAAIILIALSGCMGMGIGFFGLMVQKAMTATSFQVLQNMSKICVVSVGVTVFGDRLDSTERITGMALSLIGSAWYGYEQRKIVQPKLPIDNKGEREPLLGSAAESIVSSMQAAKAALAKDGSRQGGQAEDVL